MPFFFINYRIFLVIQHQELKPNKKCLSKNIKMIYLKPILYLGIEILRNAGFERSDWRFKIFQPIRILQNKGSVNLISKNS